MTLKLLVALFLITMTQAFPSPASIISDSHIIPSDGLLHQQYIFANITVTSDEKEPKKPQNHTFPHGPLNVSNVTLPDDNETASTEISAPFTSDTSLANNNTTYVSLATSLALLQSQLTSSISAINQIIQNNYATLSNSIQAFQISQSNFNATLNGHSAQIDYLNTRQDTLNNFFNGQISSLQSNLTADTADLNNFLADTVYGTDSSNPQAKYKISQNSVTFSHGSADPSNSAQLLIVVPFTVTFTAAPVVTVSLVAITNLPLPQYTVAVKSVTASAATIVVSAVNGTVSSSDAYSVVIIAFGN